MSRNRKRRAANGPPFLQLHNYVFDTPAFRALKPGPRALLLELIRRHDGQNNGRIGLGLREAVEALAMTDHASVTGYFRKLEAHGFIRKRKASGFNMKDPAARTATEWELTMHPVGNVAALKTFLNWSPADLRSGKPPLVREGNPTVVPFKLLKKACDRGGFPTATGVRQPAQR